MGWLLKQNPNQIRPYLTITVSLIGRLCLFPRNHFLFVFLRKKSGTASPSTHAGFMILNHKERKCSEKLQLAQWGALLCAEVGKIKENIKIITNSVSHGSVSRRQLAGGLTGRREEYAPRGGGRGGATGGRGRRQCHQEVSVVNRHTATVLASSARRVETEVITPYVTAATSRCSETIKNMLFPFLF